MVAPDDTTFAYLRAARTRRRARRGSEALDDWRSLATDEGAIVRQGGRPRRGRRSAARLVGHEPRQVTSIDAAVPDPDSFADAGGAVGGGAGARVHGPRRPARRSATSRSTRCSSARARTAASRTCVPPPRRARPHGRSRACGRSSFPGRGAVKAPGRGRRARPGVHRRRIRLARPGCSMCLAMNPDKLAPGERCASTSQPQLRGPPGPRRPHAPRLPRRRRRHRHRRPLRHPGGPRRWRSKTVQRHHRHGRAARPHATSTPTRSSRATG